MKLSRSAGSLLSRPLLSFGLILILLPLLTLITLFASNDGTPDKNVNVEALLGNRIVELNERVRHTEMLSQDRKREINELRRQIDVLKLSSNGSVDNSKFRNTSPGDYMLASELLQLPSITSFLPHLLRSHDSLRPAFRKISKTVRNRSSISFVFGIPTVKRPVESYLLSTLQNLIENLSAEERLQAIIIVFIAEVGSLSLFYKINFYSISDVSQFNSI